jgi:hypothetical protein
LFRRRYFALSPSFHGMTLFAKLVNAHPKVVCLGDTYPSNRHDQICGCGKSVRDCEFWQVIKRRVGAGNADGMPHLLPLTPKVIGGLRDQILFRALPIASLANIVPRSANRDFLFGFTKFVDAVYELSAGSEPEVYVDAVKSLGRVRALLAAGEGIDGVIHLVRDPVDYAGSATKFGKRGRVNFAKHACVWRFQHREIARLSHNVPYCRIHYEDICASPDETLARAFEFLGVTSLKLEELRRTDGETWHFLGNSSLFGFNWTVKRQSHDIGDFDRRLIECIAIGRSRWMVGSDNFTS